MTVVMQSTCTIWLLMLVLFITNATTSETTYERGIKFIYFNGSNECNTSPNNHYQCNSGKSSKMAVIVHGYTESCETVWVKTLMNNLNTYRHGCIVCMDYSTFSMTSNYSLLVDDFNGIATVLTKKLRTFKASPFLSNEIYVFGFSFGGQLALEAGRRLGKRFIKQMDVCEPAGPGFDSNATYSLQSSRNSAQNVQCIHTSADKGTSKRDCHQDWDMGNCGITQAAAGPKPLGSHGLCPYFYNYAFQYQFPAVPKPSQCQSDRAASGHVIRNFNMGYKDALKYLGRLPSGRDFFSNTFKNAPYNVES